MFFVVFKFANSNVCAIERSDLKGKLVCHMNKYLVDCKNKLKWLRDLNCLRFCCSASLSLMKLNFFDFLGGNVDHLDRLIGPDFPATTIFLVKNLIWKALKNLWQNKSLRDLIWLSTIYILANDYINVSEMFSILLIEKTNTFTHMLNLW